ncbi:MULTISPECIES: DUF502 domain-containing protein [Maricaulis]|uniref:Membrane protein n=1 Tax=Maricaulis virginensis TaxID=144022 RepID=A0A9W6MNR2_9PROT|nr:MULTISPECIES: DUF502 domain-containing protein [Maricaulis]MBO6765702.1 DUF502 domain-containing protein [Maricaulis sp.]GLK52211.1 membrane protein [Maricaulis virginensis]|tara:strand:- start:457 stop:1119 length:663 start_codon:yes stop_codon:yes gene_type:complete
MFRWLRNSFLTGIVIATPLGVTLYLIVAFVGFVDNVVKPLIPARYNPENYLPGDFTLPGLGVLIAVVILTLLGAFAANVFGRTLINLGDRIVAGVPLVRNVYGALKQIMETVFSGKSNSFKEVVLIEYPMKGLYVVAFVSANGDNNLKEKISDDVVGLFVPTTPNPTSGFLLYTPKKNTIPIDMSVEEAAKLIISFGMVTPDKLPRDVRATLPPEMFTRT